MLIAGRLIDGKLWDGKSPIRIDDVYAVQKKLKHLSDKDLSLFDLTDFVQVGEANSAAETAAQAPDDTAGTSTSELVVEAEQTSAEGTDAQSTLL